jgi:hypothetical protein
MATTAYATGHQAAGGAPPGGPAGGAGGAVPDSYFTESRKGEINELRNLLRGFASERDPQRKRDIIKKVREGESAAFASVSGRNIDQLAIGLRRSFVPT